MHKPCVSPSLFPCSWCLWVFIAVGTAGLASDAPQELHQEVERVNGLWSAYQGAVQSLEVSGYQFFGTGGVDETQFTRDALIALIDERIVPLVESEHSAITLAQLRRITDSALPQAAADGPQGQDGLEGQAGAHGTWREYTFILSGERRRRTLVYGDITSHLLRDSDGEVLYSSVSGATVRTDSTGLVLQDLKTFVYQPSLPRLDRLAVKPWQTVAGPQGPSKMLIAPGVQLEYQSETGFVYDHYLHVPRVHVYEERIQRLPQSNRDHPPVPRVFADLEFHRLPGDPPPLSAWYLYVLNSIRINAPVDESRFQIAVPEGTRVGKYFPGLDRSVVVVAPADVSDVRAFAAGPGFVECVD
jgi:hypothetical protein